MSINSENIEKDETLKEVSGAIDLSLATDGSKKRSPQSLQDIVVAAIAQDPYLSLEVLQNESFEAPHITDVLRKTTPFIQLLPTE